MAVFQIPPRRGAVARTNARGEKSRLVIVDALLALVSEGDLRPTVPRVADRARLSLRSVFHHFSDVDALLGAALDRQQERCAGLPRGVPLEIALPARVERFVRQRARVCEEMMPVLRALLQHEPHSPKLAERLRALHRVEHDETLASFVDAIEQAPDRAMLEAVLTTATSSFTWHTLRVHQGLTVEGARRAMQRLTLAQLSFTGGEAFAQSA